MIRRGPPCPNCGASLAPLPWRSAIEPCPACRRPILVWRWRFDPPGILRIRGVLEFADAIYGMAMLAVVVTFALSDMSLVRLVRTLAILFFVTGSILCVDGVLGLRTGLDQTRRRRRGGRPARILAAGKLIAGVFAFTLTAIGIGL